MAEQERAPRNEATARGSRRRNPSSEEIRDNIDSVKDVLAENMFSMQLVRRNPEIREIIKKLGRKLARGTIDERTIYEEFRDLLDQTEFGRRPDAAIKADLQRYQDNNANWRDRVSKLVDDITEVATRKLGRGLDSKVTRDLAIQLIYDGSTDTASIDKALREYVVVEDIADDPNTEAVESGQTRLGGVIGDMQGDLLRWLSMNGVQVTANEMQKYLRDLDTGVMSLDMVKQDVRERKFKAKYSAFADRFDEGLDVSDIALDYRQTVASLLEKDINQVGLDDRLVKRALQYIDPTTNKGRQLSGWEFEQIVREDPEWQKTNNAYAQYASVGRDLLKTFGFEV